jgi:hypothetical protein
MADDGTTPTQAEASTVQQDPMAGALSPQPQSQPAPQATSQDTTATPTTQATQSTPDAPTGFLSHVSNTLKHFGNDIVQAGGQPDPSYTVDATGKLAKTVTEATPGHLFKNLLVGALVGMGGAAGKKGGFGGGMGAGFSAEMQHNESQDDRARAAAVQSKDMQFKQLAEDRETAAAHQQNALHNMSIARDSQLISNADVDAKTKAHDLNITNRDQMVKNGGTVLYSGLTAAEVKQQTDANPSITHTAQGFQIGERQMVDPVTKEPLFYDKPLMSNGQPVLDGDNKPITQKHVPQMEPVFDLVTPPKDYSPSKAEIAEMQKYKVIPEGSVKFGDDGKTLESIPGYQWSTYMNRLNDKKIEDLNLKGKAATINRENAEASEASTRTKLVAGEIKDKAQARAVTAAYGAALTANNNDPVKAIAAMRSDPKTKPLADLMASTEAQVIHEKGESESSTVTAPDGTKKDVTTTKMKPMWSKDFDDPNGKVDAAAPLTPPAANMVWAQVPGHPPSQIPRGATAAFKADHPKGKTWDAPAPATSSAAPSDTSRARLYGNQ